MHSRPQAAGIQLLSDPKGLLCPKLQVTAVAEWAQTVFQADPQEGQLMCWEAQELF